MKITILKLIGSLIVALFTEMFFSYFLIARPKNKKEEKCFLHGALAMR